MKIKRDEARDLFWLVTSNSIAYMTPDYRVTTIQNFPYTNNFDLYESDEGDMWILSSDGIYVLPTEELLANGPISPIHYSLANGLSSVATGNSFSERTPEGERIIDPETGKPIPLRTLSFASVIQSPVSPRLSRRISFLSLPRAVSYSGASASVPMISPIARG